jgi:Ser/Thr protein kinase RdoA (MazF antagonist)
VIDFDDCAHDWYAAGIAYALRELFDDRASRVDLEHPLLASFVRGYRSARPLEQADLARFPHFMLMSNLLFYASLRIIVEKDHETSEPESVHGMWRKLRRKIDAYRGELA